MDIYAGSITAVQCGNFSFLLVLFYLHVLYRDRYLGLWALGWLLLTLRVALFEPNLSTTHSPLAFLLLSMGTGLLQVWGTYQFIEEPFDKRWLIATLLVGLTSEGVIILSKLPLAIIIWPAAWLTGIMLLWSGVMFGRHVFGAGKWVAGSALNLLGILNMALPMFLYFRVSIWGSLITVLLQAVILVGILIFYFDKIRRDVISRERYYRLVGENLMSRERYYRLIAENALDIIYRFQYQPKKGFEYISSAVMNITGYKPADFYADPGLEMKITYPEDRQALIEFRDKPTQMERPAIFRMIHRDGALIWTEQRGVPVLDGDGAVIAFEGIIRDITPRKRMEQDMAKLEGLNAIGQMAANIAHEIRNPMTTVRGYLQLLGGKKEFSTYKDEFELLLSELDRTNAIITEYLALSKEKNAEFSAGQLNDVISAMLPLMQADANAKTKSIKTCMHSIPEIQMNDKEIRQLILNLVRNGLEAMDSGGVLTIETQKRDKGVVLIVRDQGSGIPKEILAKLGTPFFTTKKDGTGLGLAVCYRIASRHSALIEFETSSKGTDFYVYFPTDSGRKSDFDADNGFSQRN